MPASADDVFAWHARPGAFARLTPPWETADVLGVEGAFGTPGYRVSVRTKLVGPVGGTMVAEHPSFTPGREFRDVQRRGPFAYWEHTHRFLPDGPEASTLEDHIEFRLPLGPLGKLFGGGMVERRLAAMFAYRHAVTASDLRRHAAFRDRPRLRVAITGSRGLLGAELTHFLTCGGHRVRRLVRGDVPKATYDDGTESVPWNPNAAPPPELLAGCDAVVHLAGDNLADGRWTERKRRAIRDSRVTPTRLLAEAVAKAPNGPRVFLSGSAVGIYGDRGDEVLTEESAPGSGFLADVCREWEAAATPAADAGTRVALLRTGIVLTPRGGALAKQLPAFRAGGGAVLGDGTQWFAWVTSGDWVGAVHHALMTDAVRGPVNVTAPHPVTNGTFTETLARVLHRPALLRLPRSVLRVMFGAMADEALLTSLRAVPRKLLETGFVFDHADAEAALRYVLGCSRVTVPAP
ncbi:Epimerase family protein [Urbifossiella limnaea]|uniref:Epimerase family protein n=2 Tax=Urbifossiella limnaea TaxID=2528023 RepID=A0A517XRH5_9BACT|nr:Epimerase family protein [Urbifossiella limnaea]